MSIDDPVILVFDSRYDEPWALIRGRETFFHRDTGDPKIDDTQMRWADPHDAIQWAHETLEAEVVINEDLVAHLEGAYAGYDDAEQRAKKMLARARKAERQLQDRPVQYGLFEEADE